MRNPFTRGTTVPADVLRRAGLRGERVLAATPATDGTWLLGTRDAFVAVGPGVEPVVESSSVVEPVETTRLPWEQVEHADWNRDDERFRVIEVGEFGKPRGEHSYAVADPGLLLELVRERVTASVVLQRRVVVTGRKGLFVIARRPPSGQGEISWAYQLDAGMDPDDPAVQTAASLGLRTAEEELGLA